LYKAKTGFVPFNLRAESSASDQGSSSSSVQASRLGLAQKYNANAVRLSLRSVKSAIRGHYIGSKFPDQPDREDNTNAIVYFFEHNRQAQEFRDFPKAKWAPGFVFLSESDLVHILSSAKTMAQAEKLVVASKGVLIQNLFFNTNSDQRLNGYSGKVSLQKDTSRQTKLKLRGTICTNGLQLHLLAHDTSTTRRRREKVQDDDDDDDDLFGAAHNIETDFQLDDAFIADADEEPEVELGPSTSSKKRMYSDMSPSSSPPREQAKEADLYDTINWTRGSRLLVSVAKKFASPEDSAAFPAQSTVIIGMDPGERNTMTATRIDPRRSNERTSVTIRRSFFYRPYIMFRRRLEERKAEAGID
ncbi:hypothetical protein BGZ67_000799, partial [Mortierella alpina]